MVRKAIGRRLGSDALEDDGQGRYTLGLRYTLERKENRGGAWQLTPCGGQPRVKWAEAAAAGEPGCSAGRPQRLAAVAATGSALSLCDTDAQGAGVMLEGSRRCVA